MKFQPIPHRNFLFLQGPPGPFFWQLAERLKSLECGIFRINLNGGDAADWPGEAINYRGTRRKWTLFLDRFLVEHAITDVMLFGDCRPLHMAAHHMAQLRKIDVHVFEEGYIRPDWLTLERSGVNGNSSLPRDPAWYLEQARGLPPLPSRPPITASFKRRARDAFRYYSHVQFRWPAYPFYRSHRSSALAAEFLGWIMKFAFERAARARAEDAIARLGEQPFFLFPLQLSNDFQIREHSPFRDMNEAVHYVLASFARRAPTDAMLLIKEHPLDASLTNWRRRIDAHARRLGIGARVVHIAGGDLAGLAARTRGMVTVNSTSATLSLAAGVPTIALGKAVYNLPGITHQGRLDDFWLRPQAPDSATFDAFRRVLYDRCLIYGGLASQSAVQTLVESAIERLAGDRVSHWASAPTAA
ncbi:MAG TPA: capsular biosynthesis protein [Sphingobium sp.]|nr:capsular biosynthesis protein [Sphingobium sp.]